VQHRGLVVVECVGCVEGVTPSKKSQRDEGAEESGTCMSGADEQVGV